MFTSRYVCPLLVFSIGAFWAQSPGTALAEEDLNSLLEKRVELKKGDRILFLGDSLTYLAGKEEPKKHVTKGYVRIVKETLRDKHRDKQIEVYWASTGGGTVYTLHSLLEKSVFPKKPTIVVIQIGCNDARSKMTSEDFGQGLEDLIDRLRKTRIKVIQCTLTSVGEKHDGTNPHDERLEVFAETARQVALKKQVPLNDLRMAFAAYWKKHNLENKSRGILTYDGNHFIDAGHRLVADKMLAKFK